MDPLRVDDGQLREVLKAISGERPASFWAAERVERMLVIGQILALICGAAWALFNYLTFNRASDRLDLDLKKAELHELQEGRIASLMQASIKPIEGKDLATVTFSLRLTNTSKKQVEISWVLLHWYLSSIIDGQKISFMPLRVNDPPIEFTGHRDTGPIQWTRIDSVGYLYPGSIAKKKLEELPLKFLFTESGGGATKILLESDSSALEEHFVVKRVPGQWLGVVVVVGIDGGTCCDQLFHYTKVLPTTDTTPDVVKAQHAD